MAYMSGRSKTRRCARMFVHSRLWKLSVVSLVVSISPRPQVHVGRCFSTIAATSAIASMFASPPPLQGSLRLRANAHHQFDVRHPAEIVSPKFYSEGSSCA